MQYILQSGPLKDVGVHWRNAAYLSDLSRGADENRLLISYTIPLAASIGPSVPSSGAFESNGPIVAMLDILTA